MRNPAGGVQVRLVQSMLSDGARGTQEGTAALFTIDVEEADAVDCGAELCAASTADGRDPYAFRLLTRRRARLRRGTACAASPPDAPNFLLGWPKNRAERGGSAVDAPGTVSLRGVSTALAAMSAPTTNATNAVGPAATRARLQEKRRQLNDRRVALDALGTVGDGRHGAVPPDDPYLAAGSTVELFHLLVAQGAFRSMQRMLLSSSPVVVAAAALRIPLDADPQSFAPWLCDVVVPRLSTGHPMMVQLRLWTRGTVDRYDEEDILCGIDLSILLLEVVSKATSLTVAMNRCFFYPMKMPELDDGEINGQPTRFQSSS